MEIREIFNYSLTFLSLFAAILAWIAKIRWSKQYKEAKEAQIQALKERTGLYESVVSNKLIEYSRETINELEKLLAKTEKSKQKEVIKILDELKEQERINEKNKKLSDSFLLNFMHELQTPITGISNLSLILMDKNIDEDTKSDFLLLLQNNTERVVKVIRDISEQLEEQNQNYNKITHNLSKNTVVGELKWENTD